MKKIMCGLMIFLGVLVLLTLRCQAVDKTVSDTIKFTLTGTDDNLDTNNSALTPNDIAVKVAGTPVSASKNLSGPAKSAGQIIYTLELTNVQRDGSVKFGTKRKNLAGQLWK